MPGIEGGLFDRVGVDYKNDVFMLDNTSEFYVHPSLMIDIIAFVRVYLELLVTTKTLWRHDWLLLHKEWGSGLKFGLRLPIHYDSSKPLDIPLDQLELIKPDIDILQTVRDAIGI